MGPPGAAAGAVGAGVVVTLALALFVAACGKESSRASVPRPDATTPATTPVAHTVAVGGEPVALRVEVITRYPHDTKAFTEGLVVDDQGRLFESTGRYGSSSVRLVDVSSGKVERKAELARQYFGEGLASLDGRLIQLTWKEHTAIVYDASNFHELGRFGYDGEGWGLCYDGTDLVMSDGSPDLVFRDPDTFDERRRVTVTEAGAPVSDINELECVGDRVYANQWRTDRILEIDPISGAVTAVIDASGLLSAEEAAKADVLNGIAYDPARGTFLVTGKDWPWMFEVRFV